MTYVSVNHRYVMVEVFFAMRAFHKDYPLNTFLPIIINLQQTPVSMEATDVSRHLWLNDYRPGDVPVNNTIHKWDIVPLRFAPPLFVALPTHDSSHHVHRCSRSIQLSVDIGRRVFVTQCILWCVHCLRHYQYSPSWCRGICSTIRYVYLGYLSLFKLSTETPPSSLCASVSRSHQYGQHVLTHARFIVLGVHYLVRAIHFARARDIFSGGEDGNLARTIPLVFVIE